MGRGTVDEKSGCVITISGLGFSPFFSFLRKVCMRSDY